MKPYNQRVSITMTLLTLTLFVGLQNAQAQERTSPLHEAQEHEHTNTLHEAAHVAQQTHDADSDGDGLLRIEGSLRRPKPNYLTLSLTRVLVSSTGDDPVVRKRPGRTKYSDITLEKSTTAPSTKAQGFNSSRSNNGAAAAAPAQDYNSSRSNNGSAAAPAPGQGYVDKSSTKHHVSDGSLEHTDDWIAARAASDNPFVVVLTSTRERGRDVHSGKLTGVRQHSRASTAKPVDAATPYIYRASVDENGAFVFAGVAPGAYQVCVEAGGRCEFRGHVTVLK